MRQFYIGLIILNFSLIMLNMCPLQEVRYWGIFPRYVCASTEDVHLYGRLPGQVSRHLLGADPGVFWPGTDPFWLTLKLKKEQKICYVLPRHPTFQNPLSTPNHCYWSRPWESGHNTFLGFPIHQNKETNTYETGADPGGGGSWGPPFWGT